MKMQRFTSADGYFELAYPVMWECEIIENVPSFFDPADGKGAFQAVTLLNAYNKPVGEVLENHLKGLGLKEVNWNNVHKGDVEDQQFLVTEQQINGRFWFVAMMRKDNTTVLAMYNSDEVPDQPTGYLISMMVQSIRILKGMTG